MGSDFSRIRYELDGGVATITFNRPERKNALDHRSVAEFAHALELVWTSESIRCLVITGAGDAFTAGADVKAWSDRIQSGGEEEITSEMYSRFADRVVSDLFYCPKPVIASVNGAAVGMGMDIALAADIRVASTNARFGELYVRIGMVPDFGGTYLLPPLVGLTKASELILTGKIIDAHEADRIGLLNELVTPEELPAATARWANQLANGPTVAIKLAKENLRQALSSSFEASRLRESLASKICAQTSDHREGVIAAGERRDPKFVGR